MLHEISQEFCPAIDSTGVICMHHQLSHCFHFISLSLSVVIGCCSSEYEKLFYVFLHGKRFENTVLFSAIRICFISDLLRHWFWGYDFSNVWSNLEVPCVLTPLWVKKERKHGNSQHKHFVSVSHICLNIWYLRYAQSAIFVHCNPHVVLIDWRFFCTLCSVWYQINNLCIKVLLVTGFYILPKETLSWGYLHFFLCTLSCCYYCVLAGVKVEEGLIVPHNTHHLHRGEEHDWIQETQTWLLQMKLLGFLQMLGSFILHSLLLQILWEITSLLQCLQLQVCC